MIACIRHLTLAITLLGLLMISAQAQVTRDPEITGQSSPMLLTVGDNASVWVTATSSTPTITYTCTKDGRAIRVIPGENGVDIPSATLADAGTYRFRARTVKGVATSGPIEVAVVDPTPGTRVGKPNGSALLEAKAAGKGLSFAWYKDGELLGESDKHKGATKKRLVVQKMTTDDAGVYVCEVTAHGTTKRAAELTLHLVEEKPVISISQLTPGQIAAPYETVITSTPLAGRFLARGLPKGLKLNSVTGGISGVPRVSGNFTVTVTAINPVGQTVRKLPLQIAALPNGVEGRFAGLGDPLTPEVGRLDVMVAKSGAVSGTLSFSRLNGKRQTLSFRANLTMLSDVPGFYNAPVIRLRPPPGTGFTGGAILLNVREASKDVEVILEMDSELDYFSASALAKHVPWHRTKQPVSALSGNYNLSSLIIGNEQNLPTGNNFARVRIAPSGLVTVVGLLSDDTPLLVNSWLTVNGTVPAHTWLYGSKGYIRTDLTLIQGITPDFRDNRVSGTGKWVKSASLTRKDASFLDGFSVAPAWSGSKYLPPGTASTGALMMNAAAGENNVAAHLILGTGARYTFVTLTSRHQARSIDPGAEYDDRVVDLRFNAATGVFSGTWVKNEWVPTMGTPVLKSSRYPVKGLVVRPHDSLKGTAVGFAKIPSVVTENDSKGRPRVRKLFVPAPVSFYE